MSDYTEHLISMAGGDGEPDRNAMPKGITRGYGTAFMDMLSQLPVPVLTIKELRDLDDVELTRQMTRAEVLKQIDSGHEPPVAA